MRYYEKVPEKTKHVVEFFNDANLDLVVHLGDIIDGNLTDDETCEDMANILQILRHLKPPVKFILGNHCMEGGRDLAIKSLSLPQAAYYEYDLNQQWRMLFLDTMQCSMQAPSEELIAEATLYLEQHADDENAKHFNGGLGRAQFEWLAERLQSSRTEHKDVVVCGHHPLSEQSSPNMLLLWDNEELLQLFKEYSDVVRAYFCGHHHAGGYALIDNVHHIVFQSVLDSKHEHGSYSVATLHADRIDINGYGDECSRSLAF